MVLGLLAAMALPVGLGLAVHRKSQQIRASALGVNRGGETARELSELQTAIERESDAARQTPNDGPANDGRQARDAVTAVEQALLAQRRVQLGTLVQRWEDSLYAVCLLSLVLLSGGVLGLMIALRLRRRTEADAEACRRQEQYHQARQERLLANVPAVVWIVRADGELEFVSRRIEEALGRKPERACARTGLSLHSWFAESDQTRVRETLQALFAEGTPMDLEVQLATLPGGWERARLQACRVRRPSGEMVADGLMLNLSLQERERQKKEERRLEAMAVLEREQRNRFRGEFLAAIAHELRTPLSALLGFSELLVSGSAGPLSDEQRQYAGQIHASGQHLLALTNDVLDWGKLEAGQMVLRPMRMALRECVDEVLAAILPLSGDKRLNIHNGLGSGVEVWADPVRTRQVLLNLLGNAVRYTPEEGVIRVEADAYHGAMRVTVADSGAGIAPAQLHRIFDRFQQASSDAGGTGLGLTIARQLVEYQGGRIWAESEAGQGAIFRFTLPLPPPDAVPSEPEEVSA